MYYASGNRYEGEFKNDKLHGKGILYKADGNRYEGTFENGKQHGNGVYYFADGRLEVQKYAKGM